MSSLSSGHSLPDGNDEVSVINNAALRKLKFFYRLTSSFVLKLWALKYHLRSVDDDQGDRHTVHKIM